MTPASHQRGLLVKALNDTVASRVHKYEQKRIHVDRHAIIQQRNAQNSADKYYRSRMSAEYFLYQVIRNWKRKRCEYFCEGLQRLESVVVDIVAQVVPIQTDNVRYNSTNTKG